MLSFELLDQRLLLSVSGATELAASQLGQQPIEAMAAQTVNSVRDGLWSDPNTWNAGRVPGPTDNVVIANNVTIDQASAHELDINAGTTTLAGNLQAYGSVIVRSSLVGNQGGIYFHVADDRLVTGNTKPGLDPAIPDFHPEDVGLWALPAAHVDLVGAQVTSWLNAVGSGALQDLGHGVAQQVAFSTGTATLQTAPVGWRPGDTLLLVNEHGDSLLADLVAVQGVSIQYHEHKVHPTDPNLVGSELITQGSSTVVYPKIADLTRRIQIVSADVQEGDTNHRAFTVAMGAATVNLVNVEFRDLGPRGKLGRYPVYFQDLSGAGSKLTGSSLWQDVSDPGNRFVALAGVQGLTIADNVAYRSRGDGFFMEDGSDFGNTIANNLSVEVTGGEELPNADSNVTELTQHYWLRTGNTIAGNVAAGGDAIGMLILASSQPGTMAVANTEVLGAGLFGMWTGTPNVTFNNPIAVYSTRAGFASEPAWDVDSHGATLNNPLFLFNGTSDTSYGSQIYSNDGDRTVVDGGVLAGKKGFHTHYHSSITVSNAIINVDTLLVPTYWEQAAIFSHDQIHALLLFETAYPSPRYVSPGLARIVDSQLQIGTAPVEQETADYIGSAFQNYPALPGTPIPNGMELLQPAADSGFIRVTLLPDDERWMTNIARWTVTPIGQAPQADSFIYQRQTAWTRLAGFGGYPDGFPPGEYVVKLYTEDGVLLKTGFAVVRSGQVSDLTDTLDTHAIVVGRQLFYNQSTYDGNTAGISASDDNAIAIDKTAYLPGTGEATFANVSSYSQGINGIMIDLSGAHDAITASDFIFKVDNGNNTPNTWALAPAPSSILVRAGAGAGGSDRVELVWPDGTIKGTWLEVIVKADAHTGLAADDQFFFGSMPGETGNDTDPDFHFTDANDQLAIRSHSNLSGASLSVNLGLTVAIQNIYDVNRDGQIDALDQSVARQYSLFPFGELDMINIPLGGSLAPLPAIALTSHSSGTALADLGGGAGSNRSVESWVGNSLANTNPSSSGSTTASFGLPALDESSDEISQSEDADEAFRLDEELLELLVAGSELNGPAPPY